MGAVKQAYLKSLEEDSLMSQSLALRGTVPSRRRGQPVPAVDPDSIQVSRDVASARPMLRCGLSPETLSLARSLAAAAAGWPRALVRRETFETVEGRLLTPGSAFKTDGGPYFMYLDARGKKATKHLGITNGLKFIAHCWSPAGEWLEAWHRGAIVRVFLSPLPSPVLMPGLVLAPCVIHVPAWRKWMQRALDRAFESRASKLAKKRQKARVRTRSS